MHTNIPIEWKSLSNRRDVIKRYSIISFIVILLFIVLEASLLHSPVNDSICYSVKNSSLSLSSKFIFYSQGCVPTSFALIYIIKFLTCWKQKNLIERMAIYSAPLLISAIHIIAFLIPLTSYSTVYCQTIYGISLPIQTLIKYAICQPFLAFFTLANLESAWTWNQYLIVGGCTMITFSMFGFTLSKNYTSTTILAISSGVGYVISIIGCILFSKPSKSPSILPSSFDVHQKDLKVLQWKTSQFNIQLYIFGLVPLYPIFFIIGNFGALDSIQVQYTYAVISLIIMVGYVSYLCDSNIFLLDTLASYTVATNFGQSSRKEFMRYVFHELRNPLNSITLGIDLLSRHSNTILDVDSNELDVESTLSLIKESVVYISDTLDDVSQMDIIEDGHVNLSKEKFLLQEAINNAIHPILSLAVYKHITIDVNIHSNVPSEIIGDRERIELVITKFVAHSVRRSNNNTKISISIANRPYTPKAISKLNASFRMPNISVSTNKNIFPMAAGSVGSNSPQSNYRRGQYNTTTTSTKPNTTSVPNTSIQNSSLPDPELGNLRENRIRLVIHVNDESLGYDADELDQIFRPFTNLKTNENGSSFSSGPANGLGMALARDIIKALGGTLDMMPSQGVHTKGVKLGFSIPIEIPMNEAIILLANEQDNSGLSVMSYSQPSSIRLIHTIPSNNNNNNAHSSRVGGTISGSNSTKGSPMRIVHANVMNVNSNNNSSSKITTVATTAATTTMTTTINTTCSTTQNSDKMTSPKIRTSFSNPTSRRPSNHNNVSPTIEIVPNIANRLFSKDSRSYGDDKVYEDDDRDQNNSVGISPIRPIHNPYSDTAKHSNSTHDMVTSYDNTTTSSEAIKVSQSSNSIFESKGSVITNLPRLSLPDVNIQSSIKYTIPHVGSNESISQHNSERSTDRLVVENISSAANTPTEDRSSATSFNPHGLRKFLLVDDVYSNNKMLSMALKNLGLSADFVENGALAVEAVSKDMDKYEAIFMDFTMPVMDGAEATEQIRRLGFPRLIIGVTGNALGDDMHRFLSSGADTVIPKPMRPNQLKAVINYIKSNTSLSDENLKLTFTGGNNYDGVVLEKDSPVRRLAAGSNSNSVRVISAPLTARFHLT